MKEKADPKEKSETTEILNAFRAGIDGRFLPPGEYSSTIVLREEKEDAKCRQVTLNLKGVSVTPILIKLEAVEEREKSGRKTQANIDIHPLLSRTPGYKSSCDYVLLCPAKDKIYVLLIELKSKNAHDWLDQCVAGECLMRYIISTLDRIKCLKIQQKIVFRNVLFKTMKTQPSKRELGTKVDFYGYDKERDVYHTAWPCADDGNGHYLRYFLRE